MTMTKITVEVEVPEGKYCADCNHGASQRGGGFDSAMYSFCCLFNKRNLRDNGGPVLKCPECLDASTEVVNEEG